MFGLPQLTEEEWKEISETMLDVNGPLVLSGCNASIAISNMDESRDFCKNLRKVLGSVVESNGYV